MMENGYKLLENTFLPGNPEYISSFGDYASAAFQTVLMVVVVLAVLMLTISGLQYIISPAAGGKEEATKRIWAAIIGLLIALSSYLILQTINPNLVGASLNIGNIGNITAPPNNGSGGGGIDNPNGGEGNNGGGGGENNNYTGPDGRFGPTPENEFEVRQQIKDATGNKVIFNDEIEGSDCKTGNERDCRTYVGGLNDNQVQGIITLANDCNCNIVVSGAAEPDGHSSGSSHYTGQAVDIRLDPTLNNYITSNGVSVGDRGNGPRYMLNGYAYERESSPPHWHSFSLAQ